MSTNKAVSTETSSIDADLSSLKGTLQAGAATAINTGTKMLDRVLPPGRREDLKSTLTNFANERPYLAAFLFSQILISGFPIFLFVVMAVTVTVFAITTGLLLGLLGALCFILGSVGFALIFLLPTLFFTTSAAIGIWFWGMGVYYIIKLFNQKELSNGHRSLSEDKKMYEEWENTGRFETIGQIQRNGST